MPTPSIDKSFPGLRQYIRDRSVIAQSGCWLWSCVKNKGGYGENHLRKVIKVGATAHRLSFYAFNEKNPGKMHVLHKCNVRACVNPEHLYLGTPFDNMRDKVNDGNHHGANKTHCPRCGGDYSFHKNGTRWCRPCINKGRRRRYHELKRLRQGRPHHT